VKDQTLRLQRRPSLLNNTGWGAIAPVLLRLTLRGTGQALPTILRKKKFSAPIVRIGRSFHADAHYTSPESIQTLWKRMEKLWIPGRRSPPLNPPLASDISSVVCRRIVSGPRPRVYLIRLRLVSAAKLYPCSEAFIPNASRPRTSRDLFDRSRKLPSETIPSSARPIAVLHL